VVRAGPWTGRSTGAVQLHLMVRRRVTMTLALHAADQQQYGAAWWCRMVAAPIFGSINATSLTGFGPVSAVEQKQSPP
jgi:hypothetical protein